MLDPETRAQVKHTANEYLRGRDAGYPVIIVIQPVDGLDEHDLYALLATNLEDPSVLNVGISLMEKGEYPLDSDGHVDWDYTPGNP